MTLDIFTPAIVLAIGMLLWMGILPHTFFREGERNLQWWINAAPFGISGLVLLGAFFGLVTPIGAAAEPWAPAVALVATGVLVAAACLMSYTLGTHRRPLALWMQRDDEPRHLVTEGPYRRIRHPFYTSFILLLVGCTLAVPHGLTLGALVFVAYRLNRTAAGEEARFLRSELATEYAEYMRGTGRFAPRWT